MIKLFLLIFNIIAQKIQILDYQLNQNNSYQLKAHLMVESYFKFNIF